MLPIVKIVDPCHEDWSKMTPTEQGKFCLSCQKQVVDFTKMCDEELLLFLSSQKDKKVCGRFKQSQLSDYQALDIVVRPMYQTRIANYKTGLFFSLTLLLLAACNDNTADKTKEENKPYFASQHLDTTKTTIDQKDTVKFLEILAIKKEICPISPEPFYMGEPMGMYYVDPPTPIDTISIIKENPIHGSFVKGKIAYLVEPNYIEGPDSLKRFLTTHIIYPEYEKEIGIEGRIIVEIDVNAEGIATNHTIIKHVDGAKNFDREAIRVLKLIPKWKPAIVDGVNSNGKLIIPITFSLN